MSTHYSAAQQAASLGKWSDTVAKYFVNNVNHDIVLCYSGMSGVSHATAIMLALHRTGFEHDVGMVYVRKPREKSHGGPVESHQTYAESEYILVDDFICAGDTAKRVARIVKQKLKRNLTGLLTFKFYQDEDTTRTCNELSLKNYGNLIRFRSY